MVTVHTSFVDNFEETLINASDMSFMWYVSIIIIIIINNDDTNN